MPKAGIVAFAFALPSNVPSNVWIAGIAKKCAQEYCAPVYTQFDVPIDPILDTTYLPQRDLFTAPPTLRIARGAAQWAKERGIEHLYIVCAAPHAWRCLRDMKAALDEAGLHLTVEVASGVGKIPYTSWFCKESTQPHTRNIIRWLMRDLMLKLMPFGVYKKIAQ